MNSRCQVSQNSDTPDEGRAKLDALNKTINELFEEQVRRDPEATAVISGELRLSYGQLNYAANVTARQLVGGGASIGECIPIIMPRCAEMLIGLLAVLKCGGTYVPIDPELPEQRQELIVNDCRANRALIRPGDQPNTKLEHIHWVDLERCVNSAGSPGMDNLDLDLPSASAAYVMYTSGSTGTPKGVVVTHQGVNRLAIDNGYAQIEKADHIAHCSNPSFDAATFEIWCALLNGAVIVIVPQSVLLNTKKFSEYIKANATTLFLTTALFNQIALTCPETFSQLKYLLFGGEASDPECVGRVLRCGPPRCLLHVYGPTETTTFASFWHVLSIPVGATSLPIGQPISNTQIYVMDDHHQIVPKETLGELYIGGAGVACGYLNRPELTATTFVPDPFSETRGARLYKTGDLGRRNADGALELLGRRDFQVKIRGFRVELGEVEVALRSYPGIQQAVAVVREDRQGDKRLVGYVVLGAPPAAKQGAIADERDDSSTAERASLITATYSHDPLPADQLISKIKADLRRTLPHYMVPSSIVTLDKMPLTPNGKIDRRALPAPRGRESKAEYVAPQTFAEEALSEVWRKILSVAEVGVDDNFLELGGNSVLAIKALVEIEEIFGMEIPALAIYQYPTIRTMSEFIESLRP